MIACASKTWFKKPTFHIRLPNSVYNIIFIVFHEGKPLIRLELHHSENRENREMRSCILDLNYFTTSKSNIETKRQPFAIMRKWIMML